MSSGWIVGWIVVCFNRSSLIHARGPSGHSALTDPSHLQLRPHRSSHHSASPPHVKDGSPRPLTRWCRSARATRERRRPTISPEQRAHRSALKASAARLHDALATRHGHDVGAASQCVGSCVDVHRSVALLLADLHREARSSMRLHRAQLYVLPLPPTRHHPQLHLLPHSLSSRISSSPSFRFPPGAYFQA